MSIIQKLKSIWTSFFVVNKDTVKELDEILQYMRPLPKEDIKLIGKPLKK